MFLQTYSRSTLPTQVHAIGGDGKRKKGKGKQSKGKGKG